MKKYSKTHKRKSAAEIHAKDVRKKGGKATMKPTKEGFKVDFNLPEKKQSVKKKYDVISPDGFSIRIGVPPFNSIAERKKYFDMWKKRYEGQGYYSSAAYGRIHLADLEDFCQWTEV